MGVVEADNALTLYADARRRTPFGRFSQKPPKSLPPFSKLPIVKERYRRRACTFTDWSYPAVAASKLMSALASHPLMARSSSRLAARSVVIIITDTLALIAVAALGTLQDDDFLGVAYTQVLHSDLVCLD